MFKNDPLGSPKFWRLFISKLSEVTGYFWLERWFEDIVLKMPTSRVYRFDIYLTLILRVYAEYVVHGRLILLDPEVRRLIESKPKRSYPAKLIRWLTNPITYKLPYVPPNAYKAVGNYIVRYITEPREIINTAIDLDRPGFRKRIKSLTNISF